MTSNKEEMTRKLNLLLRAWLSDRDDLSGRAMETEDKLMKEVREELKQK